MYFILYCMLYTYVYSILCIVEAKAIMPHAATAACKCSAKPIRGRETADRGGAGGLHCGRTEPQSKQKAIAKAQRACRPRPKSVPGRQGGKQRRRQRGYCCLGWSRAMFRPLAVREKEMTSFILLR